MFFLLPSQYCWSNVFSEEDGSLLYLVDFQKKVIDRVVDKREKGRKEEEEEADKERILAAVPIPEPENAEDEW